jgi:hypothetical protein
MRRSIGVALLAGALAAPAAVVTAQDNKPTPPPRAVERQSSGRASGGGERAVPRSAPAPRAEAPRSAAPPSAPASADSGRSRGGSSQGQSRARTAPPDRQGGSGDRAVARGGGSRDDGRGATTGVRATERERGGRQTFGTAVTRRYPPNYGGGGGFRPSWYYPYYPLSYGFFWDPWWGYGSPWGYGYGGYGYGGYYGGGYGGGYGGYGRYQGPAYQAYGGLRLKMKPREAEVFVDGYFAGIVDDFDGAFQQLNLDVGPHRIEVRHPGHEPLTFEIRTQPDEKITYQGTLQPLP